MTGKTIPGSPPAVTEYAYDDLDRMTAVTDGNGTIAYAYDDANRLLAASYPGGKSLGYGYDLVGNRTRLTYSDETYVEYTYDDLNRMDQVKDQEENVLADYSYDAVRRTGLEYLNGTSVSYEYNDAGGITALYNTQSDPGDISYFVYTHDEAGNRLTNTSSWGTQTYTYDNTYQVTSVDYPDGYSFPDMTYNYDPVGNRDSTVNGGTIDYQHNELNEYSSVDWTTFTSDLRGNLVNDGNQSYQYDLENRLTAVNENISYAYNPFGLRTSKTVDGSTTSYVLDNNRVIEEWEDGELQRKYIYGVRIDEPLVMETVEDRCYYHFDGLGSIQNITDSSNMITATYRYGVYGDYSLIGNSHRNPFAYTGRRYDLETGLYYYRTRYYQPFIGRFIQKDQLGYRSGPNVYTYVLNSPINYADPLGQLPEPFDTIWDISEICVDAGPSCFFTVELLYNYFTAGGPLDLEDIGAQGVLQESAEPCMASIETILRWTVHGEAYSNMCTGTSELSSSGEMECEYNAEQFIYGLGDTTLIANWSCQLYTDCSDCTYEYSCGIDYKIEDKFVDILDLFDWDLIDADLEIPGGTTFPITAEWGVTIAGEGKVIR